VGTLVDYSGFRRRVAMSILLVAPDGAIHGAQPSGGAVRTGERPPAGSAEWSSTDSRRIDHG